MKIAHLYADDAGESHLATGEVPLRSVRLFEQQPPYGVTRLTGANPVKLFAVPAAVSEFDLHTAPERQLAVSLNGWVEYETSLGEVRRFTAGEIVLVEDTSGRGHITRFDHGEQWFLHIPVPDVWRLDSDGAAD